MDKLVDIEDNFPYSDILYLEHYTSKNHPRMSSINRAAQFSPFAALTGYEDKVKETVRYTDTEIYLDEERQEIIRNKFAQSNYCCTLAPRNNDVSPKDGFS